MHYQIQASLSLSLRDGQGDLALLKVKQTRQQQSGYQVFPFHHPGLVVPTACHGETQTPLYLCHRHMIVRLWYFY